MDPIFADTVVTNTLGTIAQVLGWIGVPWWVTAGIGLLIGLLTLFRFSRSLKIDVKPADPPVSDGGSADDEARRQQSPARQDPNAKNDLNNGDAG